MTALPHVWLCIAPCTALRCVCVSRVPHSVLWLLCVPLLGLGLLALVLLHRSGDSQRKGVAASRAAASHRRCAGVSATVGHGRQATAAAPATCRVCGGRGPSLGGAWRMVCHGAAWLGCGGGAAGRGSSCGGGWSGRVRRLPPAVR